MPDRHPSLSESERRRLFFDSIKYRYKKCLEPKMQCQNEAIRAHSVQNSRVLDLICRDNHVYSIQPLYGTSEYKCELKLLGRNDASTFNGFCSAHDQSIFHSIDNQNLDFENKEHLFWLAYRSLTRELHVCIEGAARFQQTNQNMIDIGINSGDRNSDAGEYAIAQYYKAWGVWRYRLKYFDNLLSEHRFPSIRYRVIQVTHNQPSIAGACAFSIGYNEKKNIPRLIIMNIIPTSDRHTQIIFSFTKEKSHTFRQFLKNIVTSRNKDQKNLLSQLIIEYTENFFISPDFLDGWDENKKTEFLQHYTQHLEQMMFLPHEFSTISRAQTPTPCLFL